MLKCSYTVKDRVSVFCALEVNAMEQSRHSRILLTVREFSRQHPSFPEGGLRHLIFHSKPRTSTRGDLPGNGLEPAIVRVGRKILIDEDRFFEWLDSGQNHTA